jgi:hypothetical protein
MGFLEKSFGCVALGIAKSLVISKIIKKLLQGSRRSRRLRCLKKEIRNGLAVIFERGNSGHEQWQSQEWIKYE